LVKLTPANGSFTLGTYVNDNGIRHDANDRTAHNLTSLQMSYGKILIQKLSQAIIGYHLRLGSRLWQISSHETIAPENFPRSAGRRMAPLLLNCAQVVNTEHCACNYMGFRIRRQLKGNQLVAQHSSHWMAENSKGQGTQ
jgi:hypothetical protein